MERESPVQPRYREALERIAANDHGSSAEPLAAVIAQAAMADLCGACGGLGDVRERGWTDDGVPMPTCAECGAPPDARMDDEEAK